VQVGHIFDAQVAILEHKSIICPGYTCVLHIHAAVEDITITVVALFSFKIHFILQHLICMVVKGDKVPGRPRFVKEGQTCIMRIETSEMFCLDTFKEFEQMGRIMLRDEGLHLHALIDKHRYLFRQNNRNR
jgi:peptide chain release factor subunit 3